MRLVLSCKDDNNILEVSLDLVGFESSPLELCQFEVWV